MKDLVSLEKGIIENLIPKLGKKFVMGEENNTEEKSPKMDKSLLDFQITKYAKPSDKNVAVPVDLYRDWLPKIEKSPEKPAKSLDWLVEEVLEKNTSAVQLEELNGSEITNTEISEYIRTINVKTNDIIILPTERLEISNLIYPTIDDLHIMGQVACAALLGKLFAHGIYECKKITFMIGLSDKLNQEEHKLVVAKAFKGFQETANAVNVKAKGPITFITRNCMMGGQLIAEQTPNRMKYPNNVGVVGDVLVLTKPLGAHLALEAFKMFEGAPSEERERLLRCIPEKDLRKTYNDAILSMTTLNLQTAAMAANFEVRSLIEINGKSLIDCVTEIAQQQSNEMTIYIYNLPLISKTAILSKFFSKNVELLQGNLPEMSGGLLVLMPREQAAAYCKSILKETHRAWIIGVAEPGNRCAKIIKKPRIIEWLSNGGVADDPKPHKNDFDLE